MENKRKIILPFADVQQEMFFGNHIKQFNIYPKGRRVGFTYGAMLACVHWLLTEKDFRILWGDKLLPDCDKYVERYFVPMLQKHKIKYKWRMQQKTLQVGSNIIDFRGADKPENWEGFGYNRIILNEAGLILKKDYLFYNAVLPMMIDSPDSIAYIGGKPAGAGTLFDRLYKKAISESFPNYQGKTYTTFDNPFLTHEQINQVVNEIPLHERQQEIYGQFISLKDSIIKPDWIRSKPMTNDEDNRPVIAFDLAISTKDSADFTACCVMRLNKENQVEILDVDRVKTGFHGVIDFIKHKAEVFNPKVIGIEVVQFQASVIQELNRKTMLPIKELRPDKDKLTRFGGLALKYEQKNVIHNETLPEFFLNELLAFTGTTKDVHDDMVDACAYAYKLLEGGIKKPPDLFII